MNLLLLSLVLASATAYQTDPRVTVAKRGTVHVQAKRLGKVGAAIQIGTMNEKTYFLTACHVVADAGPIQIQTFEERAQWVPVSVYDERCDDTYDLAVLVAPSNDVERTVEEIIQGDVASIRARDRVYVAGLSAGREWSLRETTITAIDDNYLFLERGVLNPGDSGGPILDQFGRLVGMIRGSTDDDRGWGIRLDRALTVLDGWHVPYHMRLPISFCTHIDNLIAWSKKQFNDNKGREIRMRTPADRWGFFREGPEWELREESMDITGAGKSRLVPDRGDTVVYVAKFGQYSNREKAREAQSQLAGRILKCLPTNNGSGTEGNCLSRWTPGRRLGGYPAVFDVYLDPKTLELSLFMYRSAPTPSEWCKLP